MKQPMRIQSPSNSFTLNRIIPWILAVIGLGVLAFFVLSLSKPELPEPFKVQNFIGKVEIYSSTSKSWRDANRGNQLTVGDRILTGPESELDLRVSDRIRVRIKENSLVEIKDLTVWDRNPVYRLDLQKGRVLTSAEKDLGTERLMILTQEYSVETSRGSFLVEVLPDDKKSWVGVLRGNTKVTYAGFAGKTQVVSELQKLESADGQISDKPIPVSRKEWNQLKEAYEFVERSAAVEAAQLDLSKKAGNLFDFVFDHGTFYTPKMGYCLREFIHDAASDEVFLETEYDVFPTGSFVGMYIKIRNLDISEYQSITFETKRATGFGHPANVNVELKSKSGVIRAFPIKQYKQSWQTVEFPLNIKTPTKIDEITLVIANNRVGEYKKGKLQLRNINLIPKPPEEKKAVETVPVNETETTVTEPAEAPTSSSVEF